MGILGWVRLEVCLGILGCGWEANPALLVLCGLDTGDAPVGASGVWVATKLCDR